MYSIKFSIDILVIGYVRLTFNVPEKFLPSAILIYRRAYLQGRRLSQARNQHAAVIAFYETSIDLNGLHHVISQKIELFNYN
jgi:hypothetical protein